MTETTGTNSSNAPLRRIEQRLDPARVHLPVDAIRSGYYTDKYFVHARAVALAERRDTPVTMQVFQKKSALLAGVDEAIAVLKTCLTEGFDYSDLEVYALHDGDRIEPWESVMHISGPYGAFAHLETIYLGILSRRTRIATATREVVEAAWPKPVLYFPARHDHWAMSQGDGYAAWIAGVQGVSVDAEGEWWGGTGLGTIPHALIALYNGDTVAAAQAFARHIPEDTPIICLVDFENDSPRTAVEVARALGSRLWGIRLDTSETLVDRSVLDYMGSFKPTGVNPQLVFNTREALDRAGFANVKIVASGGFTAEKIRSFHEVDAPVDMYGVGSSLLQGKYDFTADIVLTEGRPSGKVGRVFRPNPRLERVV